MSILKKIGSKCAEGVFDTAMSKYEEADGVGCLFLVFYEPEFIQELIVDEE